MTYLASIKFQETGQAWDPSWISFEAQVPGRMWQAVSPHDVAGVFLALYRSCQYYKLSLTLFLVLTAKCRGKLVLLQGILKERTARQQIYNQPRHHIKKQRHYCANKGLSRQSYGFTSSHVCLWELDYKKSWNPKNWCFWTADLEKTLESPLDCKEFQRVHPKGNHSWLFTGKTDTEAEAQIFWPPDAKNWLLGKDLDAGKDWRQEEKGTPEDEMVGWHHWFDGHEFEQAPGVGDGQESLEYCSPWGCRVGNDWVTELNWSIRFSIHIVMQLLSLSISWIFHLPKLKLWTPLKPTSHSLPTPDPDP